jgi:hypothetical protein
MYSKVATPFKPNGKSALEDYIDRREAAKICVDIRYNETVEPAGANWRECEEVIARPDIEHELLTGW